MLPGRRTFGTADRVETFGQCAGGERNEARDRAIGQGEFHAAAGPERVGTRPAQVQRVAADSDFDGSTAELRQHLGREQIVLLDVAVDAAQLGRELSPEGALMSGEHFGVGLGRGRWHG